MTSSHSPHNSDGVGLLLAGVLVVPVLTNDIAGAGEPFFVTPELLQGFRRVMLDAIAGGVAERFQQSRSGQNGDVMGFEAQKPRGLKHVQARGKNLLAQEFILSFLNIHKVSLTDERILCVYHIHKSKTVIPPRSDRCW